MSRVYDLHRGERHDAATRWIADPVANTWSMVLAGAPDGPPGRVDHAVVYDSTTGARTMLGGRSARGKSVDVRNDIWDYQPKNGVQGLVV